MSKYWNLHICIDNFLSAIYIWLLLWYFFAREANEGFHFLSMLIRFRFPCCGIDSYRWWRWKKERQLNTCIVTHGRGGSTLPRYVITDHVINILHRFNEKHSTITDRVYLRAVDIKSIFKNWDRSYDQFKNWET